MARDLHGNLYIHNGEITIEGDAIFGDIGDKQIYIAKSSSTGASLSVRSGDTTGRLDSGGSLLLSGGSATLGDGGAVYITGGGNDAETYNSVYIGGDGVVSTNYTMFVGGDSSGGSGNVGINTNTPSTKLHIDIASITTPTLSSGTFFLIENSQSFTGEAGISLLGGTNGESYINLGDSSTENLVSLVKEVSNGFGIYLSGTRALNIATNGDVGIGYAASETIPARLSVVENDGNDPTYFLNPIAIFKNNTNSTDDAYISVISGIAGVSGVNFGDSSDEDSGGVFYDNSLDSLTLRASAVDTMTIDSGDVGIGTSGPQFALDVRRGSQETSTGFPARFRNTDNGSIDIESGNGIGIRVSRFQIDSIQGVGDAFRFCEFVRSTDSTVIGTIDVNSSSSVSYNTTSDARVKENIVDAKSAFDKIMNTRVVEYNRIGDTAAEIGLLAQEFYDIYPTAVSKGDDGVSELNKQLSGAWGIDYSKIVPLLIKVVQEQQMDIEILKGKRG